MKQIHINYPNVASRATLKYSDQAWKMYWAYYTSISFVRRSLIAYEEGI